MLKSLCIKNFRLFKDVTFPELGRVNLFVGKNNVGKSCLLEAINIFSTKGNPHTLINIASVHDASWKDEQMSRNGEWFSALDNPIRFLFHNYKFAFEEDGGIEIGPVKPKSERLRLHIVRYMMDESQRRQVMHLPGIGKDIVGDIRFALESRIGSKKQYLVDILEDKRDFYRRVSFIERELSNRVNVVPTQNMTDENVVLLWDKVNLSDLEGEVINFLRLIEPSIERIAFVGDSLDYRSRVEKRIPVVRSSDFKERIPLKTMGDGMVRLLHIILALVSSKDGVLLIDEFENGLHWKIQESAWRVIFNLAVKLNVQVFSTTHSLDCVRSFYNTWRDHEEFGCFYRLEKKEECKIVPFLYTSSLLSSSLASDVEMR